MKTTRINTQNTTITRLLSFAFTLTLVFTSLATTGCDTLDPNAIEDEAPHAEERLLVMPTESFHVADLTESVASKDNSLTNVGRPVNAPLWIDLVGTWQYVENDAASSRKRRLASVTFDDTQRVHVEIDCLIWEGTFSSARQGQLRIDDLVLAPESCDTLLIPFVEDPLVAVLAAATAYKVGEGQLFIKSTREELLFMAVDDGNAYNEIKSNLMGDHLFVGPPLIEGENEEKEDDDLFVGPPLIDDEREDQ